MREGILLPERLTLPTLHKTHSRWADRRILRQQGLHVGGEGALRVDAVQQIGDTAELRVNLVCTEGLIVDPCTGHIGWNSRRNREQAVPYTGMVGAVVAQRGKADHPTSQYQVMPDAEASGYDMLGRGVCKITVEPGKQPESRHLKRFPRRRHVGRVVALPMLHNVVLVRMLQVAPQDALVLAEERLVAEQACIHEPERPEQQREMMVTPCSAIIQVFVK